MTTSFWDTPTKDIPRKYVMQKRPVTTRRARAVRNAFGLPGPEMLCVLEGYATGLINQHTRLYFAERCPVSQRQIERRQRKLFCEWEPRFWKDEIHKLPLRSMLENEPLEFAFLDLCAALNPQTARWLYTEFAPALAAGATAAFTLQRNWRRSPYMKWWTSLLRSGDAEARRVWHIADGMIRDAACTGTVGDTLTFYDDSQHNGSDTFSVDRSQSKWGHFLRPEYHDTSVDALSALMILFPRHTFNLEACIEYQRNPEVSTYMTTFVLTDFQHTDTTGISTELFLQLGEHVVPKMRPAAF